MSHWLSVYNGDQKNYPSVHIHEIGHNIGLSHSHGINGASYGDDTCLMGASMDRVDGPHLCFNVARSWYLGWYYDTQLTLDAE